MNGSSGMIISNGSNGSNGSNKFDAYSFVLAQIQTITNIESFKAYAVLQPHELLAISEILLISISKLSDLSEFFIRKTNDISVSTAVCERLQRMEKLHHELLQLLYIFSNFTREFSEKHHQLSEIEPSTTKDEVTGYAYFDITHRYRIQIAQIADIIRRLNTYAFILKDKV